MNKFKRLFNPETISIVAKDSWANLIIEQNQKLGYSGEIKRAKNLNEIDKSDAAFIGVANEKIIPIIDEFHKKDLGGFVCFSTGFEEHNKQDLTKNLLDAAGNIPFIGANCFGFINYFDSVALWPDTIIPQNPKKGVAIISQSGGIGIAFALSQRSLPIGYIISIGNQTSITIEELIEELIEDDRITAFGIYAEEIKDLSKFKIVSKKALDANKPIAIIKAGKTVESINFSLFHTASNTGNDLEFDIICQELGIIRCDEITVLIEVLKILHLGGKIKGKRILLFTGSGGACILSLELIKNQSMNFFEISEETRNRLKNIFDSRINITNPLDFQSFYWHNQQKMHEILEILFESDFDFIVFVFSYPSSEDYSGYENQINGIIDFTNKTKKRTAVISVLPEFFNKERRDRCLHNRVVPLQGIDTAIKAINLVMVDNY
jgi:acetate---CoA ligase (ADP-forming)